MACRRVCLEHACVLQAPRAVRTAVAAAASAAPQQQQQQQQQQQGPQLANTLMNMAKAQQPQYPPMEGGGLQAAAQGGQQRVGAGLPGSTAFGHAAVQRISSNGSGTLMSGMPNLAGFEMLPGQQQQAQLPAYFHPGLPYSFVNIPEDSSLAALDPNSCPGFNLQPDAGACNSLRHLSGAHLHLQRGDDCPLLSHLHLQREDDCPQLSHLRLQREEDCLDLLSHLRLSCIVTSVPFLICLPSTEPLATSPCPLAPLQPPCTLACTRPACFPALLLAFLLSCPHACIPALFRRRHTPYLHTYTPSRVHIRTCSRCSIGPSSCEWAMHGRHVPLHSLAQTSTLTPSRQC